MKLATLRNGGPEGRLVVVSHDLAHCSDARHIAPTLRAALAHWAQAAPALALIARGVAAGAQPVERFHERDARAPLPADALDPRAPLPEAAVALAPEVAVITAALPAGADAEAAIAAIHLVVLRLGAAYAPVAVTPDELGAAWHEGRVHGTLMLGLNGSPLGRADAGGTAAAFGTLVAAAARSAGLPAGSIVGSGPLPAMRPTRPVRAGDLLRLEMQDAAGRSIFGAIEHAILPAVA